MTKILIHYRNSASSSQSGFVAFTSLLVIAAVALSISISVSLLGVSSTKNSLSYKKGVETLKIAQGCGEEALLRLRDDVNYEGGLLSVGDGSCTIVVTGTGSDRMITTVATVSGPPSYVKKIEVIVKRTGNSINVLTWKELP